MKDTSIKKLDPGKAKPIDISKTGALRLVKVQNATGSKADIKVKGNNKTIEELIEESNKLKHPNGEITEETIDELREIVKVERVKKDSPALIVLLVIILLFILTIFFVFELPWLINIVQK
jgi:hypothetical protein